MIPESFIQELLGRVDIVDVVERYVPLRKAGANYSACCPFHSEKTPSFTVSPSKQFYHCFGCGAHGSAIGFLMQYSGQNFIDVVEELAGNVGMTVPQDKTFSTCKQETGQPLTELMVRAAKFYREQLKTSQRAIDYLKGRGLTGEIAQRYGLGYAPDGWQNLQQVFPDYAAQELAACGLVIDSEQGRRYDRFRDRIMFPILDQRGNVIGFGGRIIDIGEPKYLNSPETPLFEKGRELYGLTQARQAIRDSDSVIVVEGYMDVVALAQHGIGNAVATLGTATTSNHIHKLLRQADRVVFCFDGDNAGRKAAWRALESSLEIIPDNKTLAFLFLPSEHDPDTYVREFGDGGFQKLAAEASSMADFLIQEFRKRTDLGTPEGRSHLLHDGKQLLSRLKAPMLRAQLAWALARLCGHVPNSHEAAEKFLALDPLSAKGQRLPPRYAPSQASTRKAPTSIESVLLRIALQKPVWAAQLPTDVLIGNSPEVMALRAIADAVDHGKLTAAGIGPLLEFFRGSEHEAMLSATASSLATDEFDESAMEAVFTDALERLRGSALRQEIEALNVKAQTARLSAEDRHRLATLLAQKAAFTKRPQ